MKIGEMSRKRFIRGTRKQVHQPDPEGVRQLIVPPSGARCVRSRWLPNASPAPPGMTGGLQAALPEAMFALNVRCLTASGSGCPHRSESLTIRLKIGSYHPVQLREWDGAVVFFRCARSQPRKPALRVVNGTVLLAVLLRWAARSRGLREK